MTNLQILLLIAAFLALTVGSFVWYVATWDAQSVSQGTAAPDFGTQPHGFMVDMT